MATNRKWTCQYCTLLNDTSCDICDACRKMNVEDHLYTIVENDFLHKRTQGMFWYFHIQCISLNYIGFTFVICKLRSYGTVGSMGLCIHVLFHSIFFSRHIFMLTTIPRYHRTWYTSPVVWSELIMVFVLSELLLTCFFFGLYVCTRLFLFLFDLDLQSDIFDFVAYVPCGLALDDW